MSGNLPAVRPVALTPTTITEAMEVAKVLASSELCPAGMRGKPADVLVAVMAGAEVGLSPFQSIQSVAVINGKATMWGDAVLALVMNSGLLEYIKEHDAGEAWEKKVGRCEVKRRDMAEPIVRTFSYAEAERAGLPQRAKGQRGDGPWITYPGRMLAARARSWALRDAFPDVLKGLMPREEVEDYDVRPPREVHSLATVIERASTPTLNPARNDGGEDLDAALNAPTNGNALAVQNGGLVASDDRGEIDEPLTWTGHILEIREHSGNTNSKPWTYYELIVADGAFNTFDSKFRDEAREATRAGAEVMIEYEITEKGGRKVTALVWDGGKHDHPPAGGITVEGLKNATVVPNRAAPEPVSATLGAGGSKGPMNPLDSPAPPPDDEIMRHLYDCVASKWAQGMAATLDPKRGYLVEPDDVLAEALGIERKPFTIDSTIKTAAQAVALRDWFASIHKAIGPKP